jgi:nuclear GTP-binding protein
MQLVQLDKHIKLLDSPGIVMATGDTDSATILKNCVKVETIDDPVPTVEAILRRCTKHKVETLKIVVVCFEQLYVQ